jgi:PAT family beta-lactamase induction signal transducer AmpG
VLAFGAAGVCMAATALINAAILPRPAEVPAAEKKGSVGHAFWGAYKTFLAQPKALLVLAFMFFYRLGDIMMFAMSKPMLRDIGIGLGQRGILNGAGTGAAIAGALIGGGLIARRGLKHTLIPILYLQNLAIPLYIALAVTKPPFAIVLPIYLVEQLVAGIGSAGQTVFLMQRVRGGFSASHYAFATAIVSLGSTLSGYISGPLNQHFGHPIFFTIAFVASWPALILVWFVPRTPIEEA